MAAKAKIVALHPDTGKEIPRPKTGRAVFYAVKTGKGRPKKIPSDYPQAFSKKDKDALQKNLSQSGAENFVAYERKTREYLKDKHGKIKTRKDKTTGKMIKVRKTKLSGHRRGTKERPVIIRRKKGKYSIKRSDFLFRARTKRETVEAQKLKVLDLLPKKEAIFSKEIFLRGPSVFATLKNVRLAINPRQLRRHRANAIYVEGTIRIYKNRKLIHAVNFYPPPFRDDYPELQVGAKQLAIVRRLSDFSAQISKLIRYKLADLGYRFTSLITLQNYQDEILERAETEGSRMAFIFHYNAQKTVLDVQPLVPETMAKFGEPEGPKRILGIDPRLLSGGRPKLSPEKSVYQSGISMRITAYRDKDYRPRKKPLKEKPSRKLPPARRKKDGGIGKRIE